ncbi:hypothetical protein OESDEN_15628 [Oesophagostomum dentatum]|uniref:Uncharacterized protein n=1 Tax=Oesophagostomum dentatum TaxID=61180 RepID=A0A0B1SLC2_OESDE|nr:hypothetical protein OESDEN_15628 [Oesophagostomum dentatum]
MACESRLTSEKGDEFGKSISGCFDENKPRKTVNVFFLHKQLEQINQPPVEFHNDIICTISDKFSTGMVKGNQWLRVPGIPQAGLEKKLTS